MFNNYIIYICFITSRIDFLLAINPGSPFKAKYEIHKSINSNGAINKSKNSVFFSKIFEPKKTLLCRVYIGCR